MFTNILCLFFIVFGIDIGGGGGDGGIGIPLPGIRGGIGIVPLGIVGVFFED
ncbi:MAG: hypothetical protein AB8U78_03660 [Rickettsia slovaca]|uniref:hypothetical protein n=1 Tax=Rickettsia slovaca TaxID=35794 RepID=UPI001E2F8069|nr:hypothetical protein [Rickettsia slovaca]